MSGESPGKATSEPPTDSSRRRMPTSEATLIGGSTGFEPRIAPTGAGHPATIRQILIALSHVQFPVDSRELVAQVGGYCVDVEGEQIPFARLVEALPVTRFNNAAEVKTFLTDHWQEVYGSRGPGQNTF